MVYCPDKYITQRMCSEVVDDSLAELKLIPNWFVTDKMIKKTLYCFLCRYGLPFFYEGSGDVTFCCNEVGILSETLKNVNLDNNFDGDDPNTRILEF